MKYQRLLAGVAMALLTACATQPSYQKPIVVKNSRGVPSHYLVQQGDTVGKIAQRYGLNWREVARINRLDDSHTIYAGQWLVLWQGSQQRAVRTPTTQVPSVPTPNRVMIVQGQVAKTQPKKQTTQKPPVHSTLTNANIINDTAGFVHPVNKNATVVREFGAMRQINGSNVQSEGVWFRASEGDPIHASRAGTVIYADVNSIADASIAIRHADGFVSEYRFIKDATIKAGQNVQAGQRIASMKSTNGVVVMEFRVAKNNIYINPLTVLR